jgi:hypothetical protein
MDKERFTKNAKYKAFMLAFRFWQAQEAKLEADAKEMVEAFNKDIQKQEEQQRKLEMMREHPEWFETTSPKEYGMKLMKRKNKRK